MNRPLTPIVGRLAPSPTGGLHLGHARTFLLAWLAARTGDGRVVLRIEDIDAGRVRPGMAEQAVADLRWLGLDWDEGPDVGGPNAPYEQSRRLDRYDATLERLKAAERVYPCTCTRSDIARFASAPHAEDEGPTYPGICAYRCASDASTLGERPFAWRFRVPTGAVAWDDLYRGPSRADPSRSGGDFIVGRSDGSPSYQLAVVADDAAMGVNQVIRGDDLVPSTPRQVLLYRALDLPAPRFGHVPLAVGPDRRRLAKRDLSIKLATLRQQGIDPTRLVGRIAQSCGWEIETDRAWPGDLIGQVNPLAIPPSEWLVGLDTLAALGA